ncbi:MAG: ComF family protein [Verrucomicrobiae bacterium]|jgi:competence protein ComFC|nr:ComF family protein [Verrucomicrobiae bacterium]
MGKQLKELAEAALHFIYPAVCQICQTARARQDQGLVCTACRTGVRPVEPPFCGRCGLPFSGAITDDFECANCSQMKLRFDFARGAVKANELLRDIIHRYKYQRHMWFEPFLGGLLQDAAAKDLRTGPWDALVPVPLHPVKLREREFNQAERIARFLGQAAGLPVWDRSLLRNTPTKTQTELTRHERLANVKQAFSLHPSGHVRGKSLILIDDVLTTGATTSACAAVLKKAGAARVAVWTVARATLSPRVA